MKRNIFSILHSPLSILLCALALSSCRPMGDELLSYGQNDDQAFGPAYTSFAGEFKTLWLAMNENYCIWDYEAQFGLDWDEVYTTYLPQFEALDDTSRTEPVSDDALKALYQQFMDSLHDGHSAFLIYNGHTGNYIVINPNSDRNQRERPQVYADENANITNLTAYQTTAVSPAYQIQAFDATGSKQIIIDVLTAQGNAILTAADAYIAAVDAAGGPNTTNDSVYAAVLHLKAVAEKLLSILTTNPVSVLESSLAGLVSQYNTVCAEYAIVGKQIGVALTPVESELANDRLGKLHFALFPGNIAYLRIGGFGMSPYLDNEPSQDASGQYEAYHVAVRRVWHHWFDTIQTLHASGQLGGVILDVRNNGGGSVADYRYALGALLPSGGFLSHTLRMKNGTGRLDFAPLVPFYWSTYEGEHAIIDKEPIVVLANSNSVSLAENTTWGVLRQPNGCFVGTRTYGGLSALSTSPECYSEAYSGAFGVQNVTPVFGYVPKYVCLYGDDLHLAEGVGFQPTIDVPLDVQLWQSQGRDNQLEKALDYIQGK